MTLQPSQFDLPPDFVRRFRPVMVSRRSVGVAAYVFDPYRLTFFEKLATATPVPAEAIWSICPSSDGGLHLRSGKHGAAIGYVVTQVPLFSPEQYSQPLPKRLSYRQKIKAAAIRNLLEELRSTKLEVPADVLAIITRRLDEAA